jgi:hypothetical protein
MDQLDLKKVAIERVLEVPVGFSRLPVGKHLCEKAVRLLKAVAGWPLP